MYIFVCIYIYIYNIYKYIYILNPLVSRQYLNLKLMVHRGVSLIKKRPPPLGPPLDPRNSPTVGP